MIPDARVQAPFGRRAVRVVRAESVGPYSVLSALDREGPVPRAGQFYMLMTEEGWGGGVDGRPYLPRALSFARATPEQDGPEQGGVILEFFFEQVGPGTAKLAELTADDGLLITGPFGNGFTHQADREALLVAGGIGLAPIVALADELRVAGVAHSVLVGMRSSAHAEAIERYALDCELATDDASAGHHGLVTDLLTARTTQADGAAVYACGPPPMLEAVRAHCSERSLPAELALEAGMACGFGACHGCVVPTRNGYKRLCIDGPVLPAAELEVVLPAGGHG